MPLTEMEFNRYIRQIHLKNIGVEGQQKLKKARVLCVGAGGLGSPLLVYLAAAGVGTIGIIDHDAVEISNLPRQILYQDRHVGEQKVCAAKTQLMKLNPACEIKTYNEKLDSTNAPALIDQFDIVADCTDNFAARYLINEHCVALGKPFVFASIHEFEGQCSIFLGDEGPCYQCLFPATSQNGMLPDCRTAGVLGVLPGLLGLIQAAEIIKWIVGQGTLLAGRVMMVDMLTMQFREFSLSHNPDCETCKRYRMMRPSKIERQQRDVKMNDYIISPSELSHALENNQDIQLVDVRTPEKHQAFNIGGTLIPLEELPNRFQELDPNKMVVTYCTSGGKSMTALQFLLSAGFKSVKSLDGGMTAWQKEKLK
ncbi:molybdopterin-synthase adenylyltransferase MoeB [Aquicella lusitana]|uniref:Molybdopterin-synthase adenylyltransferase n=1 Tax=Aquicella lusitana TaxID=254246 RepID=A0A370GJI8_9COXI|nr:molybdopterin-synthase adenylyltransferase MoeB [Aquicella lusitana]RDI42564.1 adenylyltransferase/sulfurtransferase [Aquicella lusitana]VVC74343.1 putative adenylyltransferase/sulfurtransferase MoeZ [Aquicella lusitana]